MAIFAPDIRIVGGSHAGARASASSWCDYVMRQGQYHQKDGFDYSNVLLPENAPDAWRDPRALWAAVDAAEQQWNAQTGREFMLPLPRELTREQCIELAEAWAADNLVSRGMAAHVVIHVDARGDRHAHTTSTLRAVGAKGTLENKRVTTYPVRNKEGQEIEIDASWWKEWAKDLGYEKIYPFKDGKARTKSEALAEGLSWKEDRASKKPLQRDRKATDWDRSENAAVWRKSWEVAINAALDRHAPGTPHVDSRSYAERGIERVAQVKQGAAVTELERKERERCEREGVAYEPVTVVGAKNEEIRKINELLRVGMPEGVKRDLKDRGEHLRIDTNMNTPREVRDYVRPAIERVALLVEAIRRDIRARVDKVLGSPACRTLAEFARDLRERARVAVSRQRGDLRYERGGWAFSGAQLGERYTKAGVSRVLDTRDEAAHERYRKGREADRERAVEKRASETARELRFEREAEAAARAAVRTALSEALENPDVLSAADLELELDGRGVVVLEKDGKRLYVYESEDYWTEHSFTGEQIGEGFADGRVNERIEENARRFERESRAAEALARDSREPLRLTHDEAMARFAKQEPTAAKKRMTYEETMEDIAASRRSAASPEAMRERYARMVAERLRMHEPTAEDRAEVNEKLEEYREAVAITYGYHRYVCDEIREYVEYLPHHPIEVARDMRAWEAVAPQASVIHDPYGSQGAERLNVASGRSRAEVKEEIESKYGGVESLRYWHEKIARAARELGFNQQETDALHDDLDMKEKHLGAFAHRGDYTLAMLHAERPAFTLDPSVDKVVAAHIEEAFSESWGRVADAWGECDRHRQIQVHQDVCRELGIDPDNLPWERGKGGPGDGSGAGGREAPDKKRVSPLDEAWAASRDQRQPDRSAKKSHERDR